MNYFAKTIQAHLASQIEHFREGTTSIAGRKMIFMVPAMPESTTLAIAHAITDFCVQEESLQLTLKIADDLIANWSPESRAEAVRLGWQCDQGALPYYRSQVNTSSSLMIVVLCGSDRVVDAASLEDFHTCHPEMIWRSVMKQSFKGWITEKLGSVGITDLTNDEIEMLDKVMKPLLECGRGDLLRISDWLDALDLSPAMDVMGTARIMLRSFADFDLPVMARFPVGRKGKNLKLYVDKSAEFFSYTMFLEARHRDKATKALNALEGAIAAGESPGIPLDDEDVCGLYGSSAPFLQGLRCFVEFDDQDDREKLMTCDFTVIWDRILKFKAPKTSSNRNPVRKLQGGLVDVLLTALWMTLRDLSRTSKNEPELVIERISIQSTRFKHDVNENADEDEDDGSAKDSDARAREYLERLVGGLDILVTEHLDLTTANGSQIAVGSDLLADNMGFTYSQVAEPVLEFTVFIESQDETFERQFGWRLPEHHEWRLSLDLLSRASLAMGELTDIYKLPVHHIPYYEELLDSHADEEVRRVLLHAIRDEGEHEQQLANLMNGDWAKLEDPLAAPFKVLAEKYAAFICKAATSGLFEALFGTNNSWTPFRKAYSSAFEAVAELDDIQQSAMIGMLARVFLITKTRPASLGRSWHADLHEPSGVATVLHPAVLEMLEAQSVYLFNCFNYAANHQLSRPPDSRGFQAHMWRSFVDLASIQSPLTGLLCNEHKNLDADVRGQGLLHRLGSSDTADTPLSTRLLRGYGADKDEDESISDTELFRETSESRLLQRLMLDYLDLHPHARDGLSLAVFRNSDIQPVIAAVHGYLRVLAKKGTKAKRNPRYVLAPDMRRHYAISVTLFTESNDETDVSAWVQQWKECWEAAETETKYELYRRCRFSIAHRIVEKDSLGSFQKLINGQFEADIAVFYGFIGAGSGASRFERVAPFDITSRLFKFPILEKACCTILSPADEHRRQRVVSNRQFALGAHHANLMHCLQTETQQTGTVVVGAGDFSPWRPLIDALHTKAEWVVCIDPLIDERLIRDPDRKADMAREIVGFGSGVGSHGQDNFTISTERFSFTDIHYRLRHSIQRLYGGADAGWTAEDCQAVAKAALLVAPELSGLSLVRATGAEDHYIRDFLAYAFSIRLLQTRKPSLCESIISLDAYRHWFDLSEDLRRPDLLWMRAHVGEDGRVHISMRLVECKLAGQSAQLINKAKGQIDNGLRVLASAFVPQTEGGSANERPDRRYWWMQLHRLIACRAEVSKAEYPRVLAALERLAEGDFSISWDASVFAFWTNTENQVKQIGQWSPKSLPGVIAKAYEIGGAYILGLMRNTEASKPDLESVASEVDSYLIDDTNDDEQFEQDEQQDYTPWADDLEDDDGTNDNNGGGEEEFTPNQPAEDAELAHGEVAAPTDQTPVEPKQPSTEALLHDRAQMPEAEVKAADEPAATPQDMPVDNEVEEAGQQEPLPRRILLGTTSNGHKVFWEFYHPALANRHMLIFGASGQGKTYAIQSLLCEMSRLDQHSLIVDYTNGFLPNHLEKVARDVLDPEQHVVSNNPLPINPFIPQSTNSGGIQLDERAGDVATRIASLFNAVYNIGDQQRSALYEAVTNGVEHNGNEMNLSMMLDLVDNLSADPRYKTSAQKLYAKIKPFVDKKPFSSGDAGIDWDKLFMPGSRMCNIFQLAGMDSESGRLVTEFILWDLYGHLQAKGKKTDPKVLVLDEVQNLDHSEGSPLSKYLREGRKFGVSLILATQIMSGMSKDERDRMFNAEHKLFFKPADTELKAFAQLAAEVMGGKTDDWKRKLSSLQKGECYSIGQYLDEATGDLHKRALKIRITSLQDRGFNE